MNLSKILFGLATLMLLVPLHSSAQFTVDGQLIVRSEFRKGYNKPIAESLDPAGFIAHRARIQAGYKLDRLNFYMSIQDIRTWGSTGQANISDDFLSVHEAYAETSFGENWKLKLGRQELNYDNARFLGNLDWALQARSHDFALMKYEKEKAKFHFGGGFNQDSQKLSGNLYTIPNQYRAAQLIRYENILGKIDYSLLFWNECRQWSTKNSTGTVVAQGTRFRQTLGIPTLRTNLGKSTLSGYFYYQFGEDITGKTVSAFNTSAQFSRLLINQVESGKKLRATVGFEFISGSDASGQEKNTSYALQYGTNHLFNGYMDWFYVANAWENSVGLKNYYLRSRYEFNPKFWVQTDFHLFSTYSQAVDREFRALGENKLGSELDFTFGWILNESVSLQGGYSQFFFTETLEAIQPVNLKNQQNWAYLMFVFRPTSKAKFIGVLQ
jgi:hypothetical protein